MNRVTLLVGALALFTLQGSASAQVPTEEQEEQMDASFRKFGCEPPVFQAFLLIFTRSCNPISFCCSASRIT